MWGYLNRKRKFNKKIWIASLIGSKEDKYGNEILEYDKPKQYEMNVQPLTAEADLKEFGIAVEQYYKTIIEKYKYYGMFKEGDLAYLEGADPSGEPKNGFNANYTLYPPRNQNKCICIFFRRKGTK